MKLSPTPSSELRHHGFRRVLGVAASCFAVVLFVRVCGGGGSSSGDGSLSLFARPIGPSSALPHAADAAAAAAAAAAAIDRRLASAAYARQRSEADRLVDVMRAAPDAWERSSFHRHARAMWVDPFRDFYRCPGVTEKVGSLRDGGKWVCGVDTLLQKPGCVVYSFGSNGDTTFEEAILGRTPCAVWTFDPTLNAATQARVSAVPGLNFAAVGLSDKDGELQLGGVVRPVRTLASLMKERGHTWVDLLKVDIEGSEWGVVNAFIKTNTSLPVTQAQIEFHVGNPKDAVETMVGLVGLGMRAFHVEENNYCSTCPGRLYELSLAHVDTSDELVIGE